MNARVMSGKFMTRPWTRKVEGRQSERSGQFSFDGVLESDRIKDTPHVYSARCVILAQTVDVKVPLLNTKREKQLIPRGTELGEVHLVDKI